MVMRPPLALVPSSTPKPCFCGLPSSLRCSDSLSGSAKMLLENVMLSCGPQTLAFSSMAQLKVQ